MPEMIGGFLFVVLLSILYKACKALFSVIRAEES